MDSIERKFFQRYRPDPGRLILFGFQQNGTEYEYRAPFADGGFIAELTVQEDGQVCGKVLDRDTGEEYLPIRNRLQVGGFVGMVREAYLELLQRIADAAFIPVLFSSDQACRIADRIREVYGDSPEFPWDDDNENAIFRHPENGKWYGALLRVSRSKLKKAPGTSEGSSSDKAGSPGGAAPSGETEVLNLKAPPDEIPEEVQKPGIFSAWHMNKKHWISVILDDTLSDEEIMEHVAVSHQLTRRGKAGRRPEKTPSGRAQGTEPASWIIPANPSLYDVAAGFAGGRTIWWHQHTEVLPGDEVFIYYGRPYSAIMFRCAVLAASVSTEGTGLPEEELSPGHTRFMELSLEETYPPEKYALSFMKEHGGSVCRSARRMPPELLAAIRETSRE